MSNDAITAIITARGAATTVPDRDDSVDAAVYYRGAKICDVTLLREPCSGLLSTWGDCPDHWCSDLDAACAALDLDARTAASVIVAAVIAANKT